MNNFHEFRFKIFLMIYNLWRYAADYFGVIILLT